MVILRHVHGVSRSEAGRMPRWERDLLIRGGEELLGIGASADAEAAGLSRSEYDAIIGSGG